MNAEAGPAPLATESQSHRHGVGEGVAAVEPGRAAVIERVFGLDGPLARALSGFRVRPQQLAMAQMLHSAVRENRCVIAEAGTGTGKTFAYLVPALLSGGKVVISTGTKTLQDQLFKRDLPAVRDALRLPAQIALLKGRANYVCPYRLELAQSAGRLVSREEAAHLRAIARFSKLTNSGDKAECSEVPENSGAWTLVTSTRENCLGQDCPQVKECFVLFARRAALAADVVVVNHHLFFADLMLRDDGLGELLPACNVVVFDEAHQLPDVAGNFFGQAVSTNQLIELARDTRVEGLLAAKDHPPLLAACPALEKAARDFRLAFQREMRLNEAQWLEHTEAVERLAFLLQSLEVLQRELASQAERSEGLANCLRRTDELMAALRGWQSGAGFFILPGKAVKSQSEEHGVTSGGEDAGCARDAWVRWVEVTLHAVVLHLTPLSVADIFRKQMASHPRAWIFTSATLSVGGDFRHYQHELGLSDAATASWDSPFDYGQCALLYCPPKLPDPNSPHYSEAVFAAAWPLIKAACGRTFVLCTSLRAMRRLHELIEPRAQDADLPLLLQGQGARSELLERFRRLGNAILIASHSFWEGVDVPGEALSLVVIDKLPFAPPDDPVLAARIEKMKQEGRNAFYELQLPRAVISMKQGAGRLIRAESDRGVLMICDPRLVDKPYGRRIWQSLPPMRRTRCEAEAIAFLTDQSL